MSYEILTDLPVPPRGPINRSSKYPFEELAVNQAFVVPADQAPKSRDVAIRAAANQYRHKNGLQYKFTVRNLQDGSVGVWRVA